MPDILSDLKPGLPLTYLTPSPEKKQAQEDVLRLGEEKVKAAKTAAEETERVGGELQTKLSEPRPAPPEPPEEPAPPSLAIRPFASNTPGEPWQVTMNKAMLSMGLMAESIAGLANKYPVGALAAFQGAMEGWNKGDRERGDREFADWGAKVEQMRDHYQKEHQKFKDLIANHDGDIESLKAKLAVAGIKAGAQRGLIEAMQENPLRILDWSTQNEKQAIEILKMYEELAMKKSLQDFHERTLAETQRHHKALETGATAPTDEDKADLEPWAQAISEGRAVPPLGMGKSGVRDYLIRRAGQISNEREQAGGPGLSEASINYKAVQTAASSLTRMRASVAAFEQTAQKNLDIVLEQSKKTDRSGVPWIDRWVQAGKRGTGDPEIVKLDAAIRTASSEVAKVVTSANLAGALSDSARHEIDAMLNPAMSPEQIQAVIGVMKRDMNNRITSLDAELKTLRSQASLKPKTEQAATHRYNPETGQVEAIK